MRYREIGHRYSRVIAQKTPVTGINMTTDGLEAQSEGMSGTSVSPRVLIIGSLPPPLGGTAVSLKLLVDTLGACDDIHIRVIDTSGIRGAGLAGFARFVSIIVQMTVSAVGIDVITLHCATTALPVFGLTVLAIARMAGKPLIIRKFAGFDYMEMKPFKRYLAHFVVRHADLYLAQTKRLLRLAHERGITHVAWFPTSRPMAGEGEPPRNDSPCRRFVFVSQVRAYKGVRELKEAVERCGDDISVDVYGPWFDDLPRDLFDGVPRIRYRGVLEPEEVTTTLLRYDALVLPTKADSEGYPGIVMEAYAAGLPVISTTCGSIPEIVTENTGILVPPGDVESLRQAMTALARDARLSNELRNGARAQAVEFDSALWAARFAGVCRELSGVGSV